MVMPKNVQTATRPVRTAEQHLRERVRDERIVDWCLTAESEDFAASQKEVNL